MKAHKRLVMPLCLMLALLGAGFTASGTWIHGKAWLAQLLLEAAWQQTLEGNRSVKPWPWADTWPVARLRVPETNQSLIVLAGSSGSALAFGPGHHPDSAEAGSAGHVIVSGHRDTHFSLLQDLQHGAEVHLQGPDGLWQAYRVTSTWVADVRTDRLLLDEAGHRLTLVTCYPFEALEPGGPLRYLVDALLVEDGSSGGTAYTEL